MAVDAFYYSKPTRRVLLISLSHDIMGINFRGPGPLDGRDLKQASCKNILQLASYGIEDSLFVTQFSPSRSLLCNPFLINTRRNLLEQ